MFINNNLPYGIGLEIWKVMHMKDKIIELAIKLIAGLVLMSIVVGGKQYMKTHFNQDKSITKTEQSKPTTINEPYTEYWEKSKLDNLVTEYDTFVTQTNSGFNKSFNCSKFNTQANKFQNFLENMPILNPEDFEFRDAREKYIASIPGYMKLCPVGEDLGGGVFNNILVSNINLIKDFLLWRRISDISFETKDYSTETRYQIRKYENKIKTDIEYISKISKSISSGAGKPVTIPKVSIPNYSSVTKDKINCVTQEDFIHPGRTTTVCS